MSAPHPWSKFWWQDWRSDPALRACSLEARGLWMDLLCIAHEGTPYGHVTIGAGTIPTTAQLASMVGVSTTKIEKLMKELESVGVFSRDERGAIFCRRMVRDFATSEAGRENISKRWGPNGSTPPNRGATSPPDKEPTSPPNGRAASPPTPDPITERQKQEERRKKEEEGERLSSVAAPAPAPVPPDFWPDAEGERCAADLELPLDQTVRDFRDHYLASGLRLANWDAKFRQWCGREQGFAQRRELRRNGFIVTTEQEGWVSARRNGHDRDADAGAKVIAGIFGHA
jgi:hypothetical protein